MTYMRNLVLAFIVLFVLSAILTDGKPETRSLHVTSLIIQFNKTDAIFTVNYDFGKLPKMYLFLLGSKSLEPKVKSVFPNFDYEIIKMNQDKTILKVKNISSLSKDYYLHDSRKFGETIDVIYIYTQDSPYAREYFNLNATPYYFYR